MSIDSSTGIFLSKYEGLYGSKPTPIVNFLGNNNNNQTVTADTSIMSGYSSLNTSYIEQNKCTDDNDDGKIGFFSTAGNIIEGVGKGLVNAVKGAIKHPFKTAALAVTACVPVVGPAVIAGLSAYGIYQGGKQVMQAIEVASCATTDAEAKAAYENIGTGALTIGTSAVGLKASASMFKSQLTNTINVAKTAAATGESQVGAVAQHLVKGGIQNAGNAIATTIDKVKNVWSNIKDPALLAKNIKTKGESIGNWAKEKGAAIEKYYKDNISSSGRKAHQAKIDASVENIKTTAQNKGGTVCDNGSGFKIDYDDGQTIEFYNSKGELTKTIKENPNGSTTTTSTKWKKGSKKSETVEIKYSDDSVSTNKISYKDKKVSNESYTIKDANGKTTYNKTNNNRTTVTKTKDSTVTEYANGTKVTETSVKGADGKTKTQTTVEINGKTITGEQAQATAIKEAQLADKKLMYEEFNNTKVGQALNSETTLGVKNPFILSGQVILTDKEEL